VAERLELPELSNEIHTTCVSYLVNAVAGLEEWVVARADGTHGCGLRMVKIRSWAIILRVKWETQRNNRLSTKSAFDDQCLGAGTGCEYVEMISERGRHRERERLKRGIKEEKPPRRTNEG
jgi:hypothetical protein